MTAFSLLIVVSLAAPSPGAGTEPTFDGKPMSFWVKALRDAPSGMKKESLEGGKASHALARIGPPAVNPLVEALGDRNNVVRRRAAMSFVIMGRPAIGGVQALAKAVQDEDAEVRQAAAMALGRIGPAAPSTPALVQALKDREPRVRVVAATSLGMIGAREATPALTEAAHDGNPAVQKAAAEALLRLEGKPRPATQPGDEKH
jgi:HEAT repeat protein